MITIKQFFCLLLAFVLCGSIVFALADEPVLPEFVPVNIHASKNIPVYSAPSTSAWRGAKGKAAVSTQGTVWASGYDGSWLLVLYEVNSTTWRAGYIQKKAFSGSTGSLAQLVFANTPLKITAPCVLTDDPMLCGTTITTLTPGSTVTFLARCLDYAYIETRYEKKTVRGFIPAACTDLPLQWADGDGLSDIPVQDDEDAPLTDQPIFPDESPSVVFEDIPLMPSEPPAEPSAPTPAPVDLVMPTEIPQDTDDSDDGIPQSETTPDAAHDATPDHETDVQTVTTVTAPYGIRFGLKTNGDQALVFMYETEPDGVIRIVNNDPVSVLIYSEIGYYTYFGTHIVVRRLPSGLIYVETAYMDGNYIKNSYIIYDVTDSGFVELSSVRFTSRNMTAELKNVRQGDSRIAYSTLQTIDTDMLNQAFADYGLVFTYGENIYSYSRRHNINYSYALENGAETLLDVREDFAGLPFSYDLREEARQHFNAETAVNDSPTAAVLAAVSAECGALDQVEDKTTDNGHLRAYRTPAGSTLTIETDSNEQLTLIRFQDAALYPRRLYHSSQEVRSLGVSEDMQAFWRGLQRQASALFDSETATMVTAFPVIYTDLTTSDHQYLVNASTQCGTASILLEKEWHRVIESLFSSLTLQINH